jgi:hypothetical protein
MSQSGPMRFGNEPVGVFITHEDAVRLLKDVDTGYVREILYLLASTDEERRPDEYICVRVMKPYEEALVPPEPKVEPLIRLGEVWTSQTGTKTHLVNTVSPTGDYGLAVCGVDFRPRLKGVTRVDGKPTCLSCRRGSKK